LGSLGGAELVFVLLLALLLFGPRRLPQIGKAIGKTLGDLRRATTDFKTNLEREVDLEEVRDLRSNFKSAKREMNNVVSEFRDLGVARESRDPSEALPPRPSADAPPKPVSPEPPGKPSEDGEPERDS
jgi:sec-independent protein translocase protein TatB